jgi:hypothetical protein
MLHQLLEGAVEVDIVRAAGVPDTGQLTNAAPRQGVTPWSWD